MLKIKIVSNPYENELTYYVKSSRSNEWKRITYENSPNSRLLSKELVGIDFAEIADDVFGILYSDYGESPEKKLQIEFEGTEKEYEKAFSVVKEKYDDKIEFLQGEKYLLDVDKVEKRLMVYCDAICSANLGNIGALFSECIAELNLLTKKKEPNEYCLAVEIREKIQQLRNRMCKRLNEIDKEKGEISFEIRQINEWKKESADYLRNEKFRIRDSYENFIKTFVGMDSKQLCKDEEDFCYNNGMYIEFGRDEEIADKYAKIINNWFAERYKKHIEIELNRSKIYLNDLGIVLIRNLVGTVQKLNLGSDAYLDECCSSRCCFDADNVYESCNNFLDKEDLIDSGLIVGQNVWPHLGFEKAVEKKLSKFEQEMRMKIFRRHWPNLSEWLEEQYSGLGQFVNEYGGERTRNLQSKYTNLEQQCCLLHQCVGTLDNCESERLFQWHGECHEECGFFKIFDSMFK